MEDAQTGTNHNAYICQQLKLAEEDSFDQTPDWLYDEVPEVKRPRYDDQMGNAPSQVFILFLY